MLIKFLAVAILMCSVTAAQADFDPADHDGIKRPGQQQLARRPYVAPVVHKDAVADEVDEQALQKHKPLRLHFLDRRPYVQKASPD